MSKATRHMANEEEVWVPAFQWEGLYEVSSLGRIRSVLRYAATSFGIRSYGGRHVTPIKRKYLVVNLTAKDRRKQLLLHSLVLMSFKGPRPERMDCCHNNGNCHDPRLDNLRWGTRKENHSDKRQHGTLPLGEDVHNAKLTEVSVREMRKCKTTKEAAEVGKTTISNAHRVLTRKSWRHVED